MEVRVNKGVSHPIEILSCGTSSCITIEEAEQAMENLRQAICVAKRKSTPFEDAVRDMASEVMGYDFSSEDGLRNCAGQLLRVAYKDLPRWKPVGTANIFGEMSFTVVNGKLFNKDYYIECEDLLKLPKEGKA